MTSAAPGPAVKRAGVDLGRQCLCRARGRIVHSLRDRLTVEGVWKAVGTMTWVPEACTLPTVEQPVRVAEFDELFATAVRPAERVDRTELRLHLPAGDETMSAARDLMSRETGCCSFFTFDLRTSDAGTQLEARVPPAHVAVLDAMQERVETARSRMRAHRGGP